MRKLFVMIEQKFCVTYIDLCIMKKNLLKKNVTYEVFRSYISQKFLLNFYRCGRSGCGRYRFNIPRKRFKVSTTKDNYYVSRFLFQKFVPLNLFLPKNYWKKLFLSVRKWGSNYNIPLLTPKIWYAVPMGKIY